MQIWIVAVHTLVYKMNYLDSWKKEVTVRFKYLTDGGLD